MTLGSSKQDLLPLVELSTGQGHGEWRGEGRVTAERDIKRPWCVMFVYLSSSRQVNCELPDVQAGFRKGRGIEKQKSSRKTPTSALLTMPKPLTVWITTNCGKFWKRWEYQTTWPASWEICVQVKKQQLELDMEQQTVSESGKEYVKAVYCHPAYLTSMQSTSWEMLG